MPPADIQPGCMWSAPPWPCPRPRRCWLPAADKPRALSSSGFPLPDHAQARPSSLPVSMDAADASSMAPTAGQPAAAIDAAWIQANRKFDARRRALLKDVERLDNDGPFRADWESLEKY